MRQRLIIVVAALGLMALGAWAIEAQTTVAGKQVIESEHIAVNRQTSVDCNFCFTCGGDWPIFAGSVRSSPATPTERGSACSGALISRADSSPFLCCK